MAISRFSSLIYITVTLIGFSFSSCKTPSGTENSNKDSANTEASQPSDLVKPEGSGISQLYLMVRLVKQKGSEVPGVIGVERSISEKQGNPLPLDGESPNGKYAFKCEVIGTDGSTITVATQNASYIYGEKKNEAIVKFILPTADEIQEARVSYQNKAGAWEVLLVEEMKEQ